MLNLFGILAGLLAGKEIVKEKMERPAPRGSHFDHEAYWADIGCDFKTRMKKFERGGYMTTKPSQPKWYDLPVDAVVDVDRYMKDCQEIGEWYAENRRKVGAYRYIEPKRKI